MHFRICYRCHCKGLHKFGVTIEMVLKNSNMMIVIEWIFFVTFMYFFLYFLVFFKGKQGFPFFLFFVFWGGIFFLAPENSSEKLEND